MDFKSSITQQQIDEVKSSLNQISGINIYFGHQSVGGDLMNGIDYWKAKTDNNINIIESRSFKNSKTKHFYHFKIGENQHPKSKIDDFCKLVRLIDDSSAIAMFKFCYVDITRKNTSDELFKYLKSSMLRLKEDKPNIKIVIFTTPLTSVPTGFKATIRKLLLGPSYDILNNIERNNFNNQVIKELNSHFEIFDIAKFESTTPDKSKITFKVKDNHYQSLNPKYTYDGGHLNQEGSLFISYQLITFLSKVIRQKEIDQ